MINFALDFTKDTIEEKLKNPFWRNFIIVWLTWNWRVWYVTFFVSEEISKNKIDYILNMYNCFGYSFFGLFLNWLFVPLIGSFLLVWFFTPYVLHKFSKKHKENKNKENNILEKSIKSEIKVVEAKKKVLKAKKDLITDENKLKKIEEKTEQQRWDEDYNKLINKYEKVMNILSDFVYTKKGEVNNNNRNRQLSTENENLFDSFGLIIYKGELYGGKVYDLTEKGKYFLKKSTLE